MRAMYIFGDPASRGEVTTWLMDAGAKVGAALRRRRARRAHLSQLKALLTVDEHILRDIGTTRNEVRCKAAALSRLFH